MPVFLASSNSFSLPSFGALLAVLAGRFAWQQLLFALPLLAASQLGSVATVGADATSGSTAPPISVFSFGSYVQRLLATATLKEKIGQVRQLNTSASSTAGVQKDAA